MKWPALSEVYADESDVKSATPLVGVRAGSGFREQLPERHRNWAEAQGFRGSSATYLSLPSETGKIEKVLFGWVSDWRPPEAAFGHLAQFLPKGAYRLPEGDDYDATMAAIAWGLGGYWYRTLKKSPGKTRPRLLLSDNINGARVKAIVAATWLGRDLINTPANAMGPGQLVGMVEMLGQAFDASITKHEGTAATFEKEFPLVHAVGKASDDPPCVIDMQWGDPEAPKVTLVGKGITFDSGGLDIKPAANMRLMKKDMGGASVALTLAAMIMALKVPVRLRLIIAAAENAINGNAFRPGDVIRSRAGKTVEIGNTDAEGRLVLADALALAGEEKSDLTATFATLTGAARVALGADLPAMFTDDESLANHVLQAGMRSGDPVWRMPLWSGYDKHLDHGVGDFCNISDGSFAGAITAALFLKRFVNNAERYAHFDLYGWRPTTSALGRKGGEVQTARTMLSVIEDIAQMSAQRAT